MAAFKPENRPLLGAHFSISKGFKPAVDTAMHYGCPVFQIFTKNALTWKEKQVDDRQAEDFRKRVRDASILCVISHASYLINIATGEDEIKKASFHALLNELLRSRKLGISFVVLHPGSHKGLGEKRGIANAVSLLNQVFEKIENPPALLIETTAKSGTSIGGCFEEIAGIINGLNPEFPTGVCLDTAHIFAAGYDLRKDAYHATFQLFDRIIGLERLRLLHLNDSKHRLGSGVDRHEHIGKGHLGSGPFLNIMNDPRLFSIPKIIETPKKGDGKDWDRINLETLRMMAGKE